MNKKLEEISNENQLLLVEKQQLLHELSVAKDQASHPMFEALTLLLDA